MKRRGFAAIALVTLLALGGLSRGARSWAIDHVQRWSGRADLGFVSCNHCHLQRIENMPWAQPRPHHASPAGLALSADNERVFIALDDLDQIVEADAHTGAILRRVSVPGRPFGLALDTEGQRLYAACRESDEVVALDVRPLKVVE